MELKRKPDADRFLAAPTAGIRGALIHGRDRGGVRERAEALARKIVPNPDDPFDVALLTDSDLDRDPARLEGELAALSMMGGRRLVRLKLLSEKASLDRLAAEALEAHANGTLNPDAFCLIEAGALDKTSPLRKLAEKSDTLVSIAVYDDEAGDVIRMIRDALSAEKLSLSQEALSVLAARLPKERGVARQEIERLVLYLGPGSNARAEAGDLTDFFGVEPESSLFEAADDAFGGRAAAVQANLRRARAEGEGGPAAVRALSGHLARLRRAHLMQADGKGPDQIKRELRIFWKAEKEFMRQLVAWRPADLETLTTEILDADRACKRTGSPDALIAERLALSIAGRARRLGL